MITDIINKIKNHKPFIVTSKNLELSEPPKLYIGENKEVYTSSQEQRTWIKDNISKTMIWVNGNWEMHSISVGVEHPLFHKIETLFNEYKEENGN